jgi:outer membrane protein
MKKVIIILAVSIAMFACNKSTTSKEMKTAYVDTSKLLEQYTEAKDIQAKYKAKSEIMGRELEEEVAQFKAEAANFQKNAQANGQAWAQQNGSRLQKKEQELSYAQQAMLQQLQQESGVEMDTLVSSVKKFIKSYGKEKGYAYIYGTGEAVSILYAEEKYDITKEIIKLLNDKYKSEGKKPDNTDMKADAKKEIEALEKKK